MSITHASDDDLPIGRVLTRREALALVGTMTAGGLLFLAGCAESTGLNTGSLTCVVKPQLTEGPYFVDELLNRSDIRSNTSDGAMRSGALLMLTVNVQRMDTDACVPLPGVFVDVWHCDALGVYSDVQDPSFNTVGQDWLRGYQVTDDTGAAQFTTIVPGWYQGRATHIHFKVRETLTSNSANEFTSQLFFDESFLTSLYMSTSPYAARGDSGRLRNSNDGIFTQGGSQLLVSPVELSNGYAVILNLGLTI